MAGRHHRQPAARRRLRRHRPARLRPAARRVDALAPRKRGLRRAGRARHRAARVAGSVGGVAPMIAQAAPGRRITAMLAGFLAVAGATLILAVSGANDSAADTGHGHSAMAPAKITKKQAAFHDAMRKLWEDHITWTH